VPRAAYGERTLTQLGRQFSLTYPIANALHAHLGWTHYRALMRPGLCQSRRRALGAWLRSLGLSPQRDKRERW